VTGLSSTERLLTPEELAERWQVASPSKKAERIYRMVHSGQIPPGAVVRLGSTIRFRLEVIEAFEADGGHGPESAAATLDPWLRPVSASKRPTLTAMSEAREMLILTRLITVIMLVECAMRLFAAIPPLPSLVLVAVVLASRRDNARNRKR
jgi:hypothetical protein